MTTQQKQKCWLWCAVQCDGKFPAMMINHLLYGSLFGPCTTWKRETLEVTSNHNIPFAGSDMRTVSSFKQEIKLFKLAQFFTILRHTYASAHTTRAHTVWLNHEPHLSNFGCVLFGSTRVIIYPSDLIHAHKMLQCYTEQSTRSAYTTTRAVCKSHVI